MYYIVKFLVRLYFRVMYKMTIEGRENIPKDTTVIYACNHRSNADPPMLGAWAKGKFAFMAKEELFRNKLFAWLIRSLGAFPVARGKGDTGVIDTSVDRLDSGRSLMIFPEGTRSKDGKVGRGHTGAALISARSGKQIVPSGICYGEKLKFRTPITLKFGAPIDPAEYCEVCDEPNPRQLVKLKNRYMADIKFLVEGEPEEQTETKENESNE
ncbi:MAG: 1-acyl-sn-glycerol-3-phosphate acyltransferase [Ruminococcus sp.]|uniref:lysophospholipid acyltransferase family protein n=1 Tax=Ruminococcus sp. TaxID=41978 RepID=UPI0025EEE4AA|nr:lysophospholipid acyltransferase family protein [Ruminococcus sp.]MCR4796011.1 1-acyl-sn-glycerol-3-phosphate acyltransferase [Ruminococcus sp.]